MIDLRGLPRVYWILWTGALINRLGGLMANHGWYLLFYGDAITTLAYAVIVWLRIPETRPEHVVPEKRPPPWTPLADRNFMMFIILITAIWMLFLQSFATLPVDLR